MKIGPWDSESGAVYVVAEVGINHNGALDLAVRLIRAAKDAGADAVKFQMFRTSTLVARRGPTAKALRQYELTPRQFRELAGECRAVGISFLASVFDLDSLATYLALDPPAIKIGSGEVGCSVLLQRAGRAGLPVILSTGMATMKDVAHALHHLRPADVALLHCVSAYPAPLDQVNLRAMDALRAFHCPVGWSDHSLGDDAACAAVARGACIIERHLTLSRGLPGPDHMASMEPAGFAFMVQRLRRVTMMLGHGRKEPMPCEAETMTACGR